MLIYKCRDREREHSREREREREREGERQRERDRDGDRDRDRGREYRREARESSGAVNDSTSMRPKDVCLFLSIYYLAKLCTVSSMVNLWAAASAVERSAPPDRNKNAFSTAVSDIYRTRKAARCIRQQHDWAVFLADPGKADVLSCLGFAQAAVAGPSCVIITPAAPSVLPIAVLCSLRFWATGWHQYMWEKHICLYIFSSVLLFLGICLFLARFSFFVVVLFS